MIKQNRTFIVAEIGHNHEGSYQIAKKLILEAKKSGADAVKFQYIDPMNFFHPKNHLRIQFIKKVSLSFKQLISLKNYCKKIKILFFCTVFDYYSAKKFNKIQNIFKISSTDNNNYSLIKKISNFNKTLIISTGMAKLADLKNIYDLISKKNKKKLHFLHCISKYPTKKYEAQLDKIDILKNTFPNAGIGYSDHTLGIEVAKIAASKNITILEKHFTLDHDFSDFRDHKLSADPKQLKQMVTSIRKIEKIRNIKKGIIDTNNTLRRGIYFSKNLKKNHIIKERDLLFLRPKKGVDLKNLKKILNLKLINSVKKNQVVTKKNLSN
jgi:N,N'-diacetyllegionaminate synthase